MGDSPAGETHTVATPSQSKTAMQDIVYMGTPDPGLLPEMTEGSSLQELLEELAALRRWKQEHLLEREKEHLHQQRMFNLLCKRCDSAIRYLVVNEANLGNDLPIEILLAIFRFTLPPNALLDPSCRSVDSPWSQVMEQKILLTQVCSRWRSAALPFLYEEVWLRHAQQVGAFRRTLSHTPEFATLVRKIAVDIPNPPKARDDFRVSLLTDLATVLRTCTALGALLFTDAFCVVEKLKPKHGVEVELLAFPEEIADAICERSATLQHLGQWPQQFVAARYRFPLTTIMSCQRLISLTIDIDPAVGVEPVHLPLLEELDLSRQWTTGPEASNLDVDSFAVWRLPRLSRVVLPVATHRYSIFLREHGKTITYLEFRSHWLRQTPPRPWIWGDFTSCPKLRHLVLEDSPTGNPSEDQLLAHPKLKYIDFWSKWFDLETFCDMRAKHAIAPNVPWKNVRLLDPALKQLGQLPTVFPPDTRSCELPSLHSVLGMSIVHTEWAVYRGDLPTVFNSDDEAGTEGADMRDPPFVPNRQTRIEADTDTESNSDTEDDSETEEVDSEFDDESDAEEGTEDRDRDGDERDTEDADAPVE